MLALIVRLLKREPLPSGVTDGEENRFWIDADGVLHGPVSPVSPDMSENGDSRLSLWRDASPGDPFPPIEICVEPPCSRNGRESKLVVAYVQDPQRVFLEVTPASDEDLVPVALVQALLSEGLTQSISDAGHHAMVHIGAPMETGFTKPGLTAQIVPLLPFASHYTGGDATAVLRIVEYMWVK